MFFTLRTHRRQPASEHEAELEQNRLQSNHMLSIEREDIHAARKFEGESRTRSLKKETSQRTAIKRHSLFSTKVKADLVPFFVQYTMKKISFRFKPCSSLHSASASTT